MQLYREYFFRGQHGYQIAGSGQTDDRGEYRIHGLTPGMYHVAALYQKPVIVADGQERPRVDADGKPLPELRYAVTFYPGAQKLIEAIPVCLKPGQELGGIDIFITPVPTVSVRGRVTSGLRTCLEIT